MALLDPVLGPLLHINPLLAILIISFIISLTIVLVYRKLTDQNLMKNLKKEIKELQAEMKTLKDKPDKMMQVNKKAMETNTKYMMHSMKPTLITFLPIILIFGWLNAHMAYWPIVAGEDFTVTAAFDDGTTGSITIIPPPGVDITNGATQIIRDNEARWVLEAQADEYTLEYKYQDRTFSNSLIVTESRNDRRYAKPMLSSTDLSMEDTPLQTLTMSNERIHPLQQIPIIRSIPWIGGFGWLGTYILFSITFSIALRRILKVY